jgi:hypothetical protein
MNADINATGSSVAAGTAEVEVDVEVDRPESRADARNARARARDEAAEARDVRASQRDQRFRVATGDEDQGFAARFLSAGDRDDAAGDRVDAQHDRQESETDRLQAADLLVPPPGLITDHPDFQDALEQRGIIGQAQGLLMASMHIDADSAFEVLRLESVKRDIRVRALAEELIESHGGLVQGLS